MKTLIFVLILSCLALNVQAQQTQQVDSSASTWQSINLGASGYGGFSFINTSVGWTAVDFIDSTGFVSWIYKTTDGGTNWDAIGSPRYYFNALFPDTEYGFVDFYDSIHGYVMDGNGDLLATQDGANTWNKVAPPNVSLGNGLFVFPPNTIFITGRGAIARSVDGGQTWSVTSLGDGVSSFTGIAKFDSSHLIAVGGQSGYTTNTPITRIYYAPLVYLSSNAGATWVQDSFWIPYAPSGTSDSIGFSTVVGLDTSTALAFTNNALWRTADHAQTWQRISMGETTILSASFINSKTGLGGGEGGVIVQTDDGGLTWASQATGLKPYNDVYAIQMLDSNNAFATGTYGAFIRTTNGGLEVTQSSQQSDSLNIQIYPQPSGGGVTLNYQLPRVQHVSITLYSMAGNLTSQLLSNDMEQGSQSVSINTQSLASGTYTFVLTSEQYHSSGMISVIH